MKPFMRSSLSRGSRLLRSITFKKESGKVSEKWSEIQELSNFHQIKILKKDLWIAHLKNSEVDLPNFRSSKFS